MQRLPFVLALMLCAVCTLHLWGQNVSSVLQGTVVDSTNAVVVGARVQLINQDTATERNAVTGAKGLFRFPELLPGTYKISIQMSGFKGYTNKGIILVSSETRDLGNLKLDVGAASEEVVVNADVASIQTSSSEKASTIDPGTMENQTVRGRDMVAFMDMVTGLVDVPSQGQRAGGNLDRNVSSKQALTGITLNGADAFHINFTVDGVPALNNSDEKLHYEPNSDSIQEVKVLSSNYQAEFGRNSGGTITVITKGGTSQFHGSGWWAHKHEQFNATDWYAKTKTANRSNVSGWSFGGPIYVPGKFNTSKNKLFFFATQEFTRQLAPSTTSNTYATFPTEEQVSGNFTDVVYQTDGSPVPIYYNGSVISGCEATRTVGSNTCILTDYKNTAGAGVLSWFRNTRGAEHDTTFSSGSSYYRGANWMLSPVSGSHPRRNDMIRIDANVTSNLNAYFRWIEDNDSQVKRAYQATQDVYPYANEAPGHGYVGNATWTINPTTVNALTVGYDWTGGKSYGLNPSEVTTSTISGLPMAYSYTPDNNINGYQDLLPSMVFDTSVPSGGPGGPSFGGGSCQTTPCNAPKFNPFAGTSSSPQRMWTISDNLSKQIKSHSLKAGFYFEDEQVSEGGSQNYNGMYAFGTSRPQTTNANDAGDSFANAYMGNFAAYKQYSARIKSETDYKNVEWYVQDSWRATSRLTLDTGVRFYHIAPYSNPKKTSSYFSSADFNYEATPAVITSGTSAGTLSCASSDGAGSKCDISSGYYSNGMVVAEKPYSTGWLAVAPRLGFAMDVFGNGKTAIRGGFGVFFNRERGQVFSGMVGQAPLLQTANLSWGTFTNLSTMDKPVSPSALSTLNGKAALSYATNSSFGIQQSLGHSFVLDVSYVGAWARNQATTVNLNPVPLWSCYSCQTPAQDALRPYLGYENISDWEFRAYNNYHSLQSTVQRRFSNGMMVGVAYTLSKQLTLNSFDPLLSTKENKIRNYGGGPAASNVMINYSYDLPKLSKKLGDNASAKLVGAITDNWTLSGITHFASGSAYTPSCGVDHSVSGYDATGTPGESAFCDQNGNPKSGRGKLKFNPTVYTIAAAHTLGNAAQNSLVGPGINNWDITVRRAIPLGAESRRKIILEAAGYNVFNHPQFQSVNSSLTYSCSGSITNNNECSGAWTLVTGSGVVSTDGKPGSGAGSYTTDTQQQRMLGFNARVQF
jgi:hypothetical protein